MVRARAFTLVELLTVIAIIAILSAILMPAAMSVRAMAYEYSAVQSLGQLGAAESMYASDNDETYMPAFYVAGNGIQFWFGSRVGQQAVNVQAGLLRPYTGKKTLTDPIFQAKPYLGDMSGFGYNWAFLGSDFGVTGSFLSFPNRINEATSSALSDPSKTIEFATSSFYNASWLPKGDGRTYDLGFIDPPAWWYGNPDVDFRHMGNRIPVPEDKLVASTGNAPVVFVDGHSGKLKQTQVRNLNFTR